MRKRLLAAVVALGAVALAAGAAPALTSDNGAVTLTIHVTQPQAPCLTVDPAVADFGSKPFSTATTDSSAQVVVSLGNCGTANEHVAAAGTAADGPSGPWTLTPLVPGVDVCPATNAYALFAEGPVGGPAGPIRNYLSTAPTTLGSELGVPYVFPATPDATRLFLSIVLPCEGSSGAGETHTLSAMFTAVLA